MGTQDLLGPSRFAQRVPESRQRKPSACVPGFCQPWVHHGRLSFGEPQSNCVSFIVNHQGVVPWGYCKLHGLVCCAVWDCHGSASVSLMESRHDCMDHLEGAQQPVCWRAQSDFYYTSKQSPLGFFGAGTLLCVTLCVNDLSAALQQQECCWHYLFLLPRVTRKEKREMTEVFQPHTMRTYQPFAAGQANMTDGQDCVHSIPRTQMAILAKLPFPYGPLYRREWFDCTSTMHSWTRIAH